MVSMTDQLIGTPTVGDLGRRRSHTTSCVNVREWMIDGRCCRGTARQDCLDSGRVLMDKPSGAPALLITADAGGSNGAPRPIARPGPLRVHRRGTKNPNPARSTDCGLPTALSKTLRK